MMSKIKHVAIIMDGNGRWAQERKRPRIWGHIRGVSIVSDIVEVANNELKIDALTLYAFSTENWVRPVDEIKSLFFLLKKYISKEGKKIIQNNIRFKVIGSIDRLPLDTVNLIVDLENKTKSATGLKLNFAFDYGGRKEIVEAVNRRLVNNSILEKILPLSEEDITNNLFLSDVGDVDLLIRTGGDQRISNFLLWQLAYAELFFTHTKWPDFTTEEFKEIYKKVSTRERRFGDVSAGDNLNKNIEKARKDRETIEWGGQL
ncbi:MAG: di-trans,poly-cis-decaprenylcistransferase [Oligoflexia bacterium]|nr:di-trans,poly-cis-decaprenylcistransferase [Oligoflexia bacterium]